MATFPFLSSAHALCLPFPIIAAGFLLARPVLAQVSDRPQSAEEPETATSQPVDDDWALVQDAQNRLARHDFAGAIRQLDRVEPQSDAAFDARLVRQQIQDALRPHLRGETIHFLDTQPLHWGAQRALGSVWVLPNLEFVARTEWRQLFGAATATPKGAAATGGDASLAVFDSNLWFKAGANVRRWSDGVTVPNANFGFEARWLNPLRILADVSRRELLITEASIAEHITFDAVSATARLHDWAGYYGELHYEERAYSDENVGRSAHAWALVPIIRRKLQLSAGYAAAYAHTVNNRWSVTEQLYLPYFTPLDMWRHGPLLVTSLNLRQWNFRTSGEVSVQASETDPNSDFWGARVRRDWFYAKVETSAAFKIGSVSLRAKHEYNHQIYYQFHETSLSLDLALQ